MDSNKNSNYNQGKKNINQNESDKDKKSKESIEKDNSINSKENQNYLNEINNKEKSIINIDDENLLISFSYISEINKTNLNEENNLNNKERENKDNLNICNYYEFTPKNNNVKNTYNEDIKKKNLNYIYNILNSDNKLNSKDKSNKTQIFKENNNKSKDNSLISYSNKLCNNNNFNLSSLKDISSIEYKNSNKKENSTNFFIENPKNINIINSNDKTKKIEYEINNVNSIELINNNQQKNKNLKQLNEANNYPKHIATFSFGISNFNLITNNGKHNNEKNHIIYDENKLNNIIENNNDYFSPKFNDPNDLKLNKNNNEIQIDSRKKMKNQFQISHIDSNNIINGNRSIEPENNLKYSNLKIAKGFQTFSIIDKKRNIKYKKIDINKKKDSKDKNISYKKNKNKLNKSISPKKKIFPNEEELNIRHNINNNRYNNRNSKNNKNKNISFDKKNTLRKYSTNRLNKINIFSENNNSNKTIDQNLKQKIQYILEKNFELILSNNLLNNNVPKRNSFRFKSNSKNNSNCSFNSNYSNSSFSTNKNINKNINNSKGRNNKKIYSSILYKGKQLDSKYIYSNNTFNKGYINNKLKKKNSNKKILLNNTMSSLKNKYKTRINNNNAFKRRTNKNETNIIKIIKTKTGNGVKQEKTYIIENKDINIFNIDIDKSNNSLICYNIKQINNGEKKNKINNIIDIQNSNSIMNSTMNKYKKKFEVIKNFKYYKKSKYA